MTPQQHVPVLLEEALEYLNVRPGGVYVDATLGLGGHSSAIAKKLGGQGKLIAFDRDPDAMSKAQARLEALKEELGAEMPTVQFEPRAFSEAGDAIAKGSLDGLLADFGVSSMQLDEAHRGFSFRSDGPLDMRMDTRSGETAGQVVNEEDENELADLIYEFGEERRSRRIARAIVRARPISTTAELARIISAAAPPMKGDKIHPATRTFQAIRMRVNDELGEIQSLLKSAGSLLKPGGRLVMISFHSLEDRLVKDAFRELGRDKKFTVLTKKPVIAAEQESLRNPRSRSAKLRALEKV
ncbi:16S rRNA (cytosine(1402)-N(4))-methyltransferase RsmH [Granulicella tundricola]|uniref:Ribosomal RNA small subunit methyltransferase H n=1 Tax=Granulicella tundricola (strain ATCC BAA-1859 / DSM 23138 / MP5ACTX9) TaxID=1198114 RepID=E8WXA3_GRATM|nr:16S rRNA (cytosine(1402)-N(4))-methyltransferase RsmH [Granulicella tundricola]ADW69745.1 S-adenosyl-methyltransferase MraW [Granulicella tundricola MP5ACTX9]